MKQKIFILAFFTTTLFAFNPAKAQLTLGAGVAFDFTEEATGLQARAIYGFSERLRVGTDFIYFLTTTNDSGVDISSWEINLNGHFLFATGERIKAYGLVGLNHFSSTVDYSFGGFEDTETDTSTGVNLGAGAQLHFSETISLLLELKYRLGDVNSFLGGVGVAFTL